MKIPLISGIGLFALFPSFALAQPVPTCEQKNAVLSQLVDDMARVRGTISTAEIEAATLKIQIKTLQDQQKADIERMKKDHSTPEMKKGQ